MLRRVLRVPHQETVFSMTKPFPFKAFTDVGFGGESTGAFESNRYFRGELVGDSPYAAIAGAVPEEHKNIRGYDGFTIRVKTRDLRPFAVSFKVITGFGGSRFQGFCQPTVANQFTEYSLRFHDLVLVFKGKTAKNQIQLDVGRVERMYFTVGGKHALPGKFELEIDRIRWINFYEEEGSSSFDANRFLIRHGLVRA